MKGLSELLSRDPEAYRAEVERIRKEEPERYAALLEEMRHDVERTNAAEDRPLTALEVEELITRTSAWLGWSRERVIAEGVLRLRVARHDPAFTPVTPEEDPQRREGRYARRRSSMNAIVVGDVKALLAKRRPGSPSGR